jgi:uncharacterized protein
MKPAPETRSSGRESAPSVHRESQSRLTSAATVQGFNARRLHRKSFPSSRNARVQFGMLVLLAGLVTGCVNLAPQTDATRFYVLEAATPDAAPADTGCSRTVLIGPVRLAGHLEQPTLVERVGDHEVRYLEWHRWAEPLTQAVPRALVRRLASELPADCVAGFQRVTPSADTLQVEIEIDRLELTSGNQAVLAASWRILKPGGSGVTRRNEATFTASFDPGTNHVAAGVTALSAQFDQLARTLAAELPAR